MKELTGSDGIGDVGSGGSISLNGNSSDDLDKDDKVISRLLSLEPMTGPSDEVGVPTTIKHRF